MQFADAKNPRVNVSKTRRAPHARCHACKLFRAIVKRHKGDRGFDLKSSQRGTVEVYAANAPTDVTPLRFGVGSVQEIPVFPLSVVAFPTADVPLNIFEARYRVLFNTLLAGSQGIIEDLVSPDKPWTGTRLFGMCYINGEGKMASVGTTLHIQKHLCADDGRMTVVNKGVEKFRVVKVTEQRPVMICQVEILEDEEDDSHETAALAKDSLEVFKSFVQLNMKLKKLKGTGAMVSAVDEMTPRQTSYWLAAIFAQNAYAQQALLEEKTVKNRLLSEKEVLESITKMLRAQLAVQSALEPQTADGEEGNSTDPQKSEKPLTGEAEGDKQ